MNEKTHFVAGYCIARGFHCSLVYDRVENRWTKKLIKSTYFDDLKSAELVLTEIKVKWKQAEVYEIIHGKYDKSLGINLSKSSWYSLSFSNASNPSTSLARINCLSIESLSGIYCLL